MSDINFLDNAKHGDDQEPKGKGDKKNNFVWSNPREAKSSKSSTFSSLPFLNKKEPSKENSASAVDKKKIKESREEILNLIKHNENSKPLPKEKNKSFLRALGEKFIKRPRHKDILIDYQNGFNQEKEQKNQTSKIFNIKPEAETKPIKPVAGGPKVSWLNGLIESFKRKIIAQSAYMNEKARIIKFKKIEKIKPITNNQSKPVQPEAEFGEKSDETKEIKIKEREPVQEDEIKQRVIETNLMQGELVTFFDWRSKIIVLASAILVPIFLVGAVYYGLVIYQKSSQAKNLEQAKKFIELEQNITNESAGLEEVYAFEAQLKTVSQVFKQHLYWTNFFNFLEDNLIKNVYFVNFDGDTSGKYVMNALATSYNDIVEQVNIFKNNKNITAIEVSGGDMAAGDDINKFLVKFILNFTVSKSIFTE